MTEWPIHVLRGKLDIGVVLVHDITGLDKQNLAFAQQLSKEGFWVATVDLFRGQVAATIQDGMALRQQLTPQDIRAALRAGYDRLHAEAPRARIGCMGFCMGGGAALEGACGTPFAFCVDYYGMMQDADAVRDLAGPVFLVLASEDDRINPWAYSQLLPKLDEHRKRFEVQCYPATVHPFHRPDWEVSPFSGVKAYDAVAAADAWAKAMRFIREHGNVAPRAP